MKWYWWVLIVVLALNALVIFIVGLFLLVERLRARRALSKAKKSSEEASVPGR